MRTMDSDLEKSGMDPVKALKLLLASRNAHGDA